MSHLDICKAQLPVDEGRKLVPYTDSQGILTVGIGRNLQRGLRPDEVDYLFSNDLNEADVIAHALFPSFPRLSDNRKAVLVNMAFNMGQARLAGFAKMRAAVEAGDYSKAAEEMLNSRWATQVGDRSKRLAKMMVEG